MEDCYLVGLETIKLLIDPIFGVNWVADWAAPILACYYQHNWFQTIS